MGRPSSLAELQNTQNSPQNNSTTTHFPEYETELDTVEVAPSRLEHEATAALSPHQRGPRATVNTITVHVSGGYSREDVNLNFPTNKNNDLQMLGV
ncbi:hypothetical protein NQ318_006014 [Aromia moschata]|uniref:Uncharacterized protein n=1 Tax=Aromia moschata TaxID=1265417 RepID=A0AAV8XZK9_9CUCU|nr:hypothetical protein NQ318_006014 [Aromia moschata]